MTIIYHNQTLQIEKDRVTMYSIVVISFGNFLILYAPKLFILCFQPDRNTQEGFGHEMWRRVQKDTNHDLTVSSL